MKSALKFVILGFLAVATALVAGCASDASNKTTTTTPPPPAARTKTDTAQTGTKKSKRYNPVANPAKVKFGEFKRVEIKPTTIAERHAQHKGNQESAAKIDAMLQQQLRILFPEVVVLPVGAEFSQPADRTLQMAPHIKEIRLIATGTRIWLGVMAGGSDLLMQVIFRDSANGEVIADPEVAAGNNAWSGAWTMGATDNQIRDSVVREIMGYLAANK
jgi:hypothetical protein